MTTLQAATGPRRAGHRLAGMAWPLLRTTLAALAAVGVALEHGFYEPPLTTAIVRVGQSACLLAYFVLAYRLARSSSRLTEQFRFGPAEWGVTLAAALGALFGAIDAHGPAWRVVEAVAILRFAAELWGLNVALARVLERPGVLFPMSFIVLIVLGTFILKTPVATPADNPISWLDAGFTMTSAVCVTGLVVRSTAEGFTPFGQAVIAIFIQLGGLGIILFGSTLAMLIGRSLSLRENLSLSQMLNDMPMNRLLNFGRFVLLTTLGIELVGAVFMYPLWEAAPGETLTPLRRAGLSAFHSISAFCNAGFDLTGRSLEGVRYGLIAHAVILPLVVLGGLGFPVLADVTGVLRYRIMRLVRRARGRPVPPRRPGEGWLALHSKLVLVTTLVLFLVGGMVFMAGQLLPNPRDPAATPRVDVLEAVSDATFMSVAARTAGFNTIPMNEVSPVGRTTLMTLMIIGGAPGSTAGGMKVTTLAVLVLSVVATLRRREETEAFGRAISDTLVRRAGTLGLCYAALITTITLLLTFTESAPFEVIVFEAVSGCTTTGLSLGLTQELTPAGRTVMIAAMFLGRVGPLTLLAALMLGASVRRPYAYAHDSVLLG